MQKLPLYLLMIPLMFTMIGAPAVASAKHGNDDDDRYESRDDDRDDDDSDDDRRSSSLEIEADVFTDITIVKVEGRNSKKTSFSTDADTRSEVIDEVLSRFDFTEAEVEAALDLEFEDRASRPQDRAKLNKFIKNNWNWNNSSTTPRTCNDSDDALEIEADVFTDTTVVKIEFVNAKDEVFTTSADTKEEVIDAVKAKYSSLTTSQIETAFDFEIEDRASRASDTSIDDECRSSNGPISNSEREAKIAELRALIERLISLLRGN